MLNALKQFVVRVTGWPNNQFHLTRLRLTGIYALLLLCILVISSTITHSIFSSRLESRFRTRPLLPPHPVEMNDEFRSEAREELVRSLFLVNGILFIGAVGLSYWLAGITLEPIQAAYQQQRDFLSNASHELRTPLAILQTDLENELANKNISAPARAQIQSHLEEVGRMSNLVRDLLLISRLENEEALNQAPANVDLRDIVTAAVARLQKYAHKQSVDVRLQALPAARLMIQANREHILQGITNLLKNGIEYNHTGGHVLVELKQDKHQALLTVIDNGIGIPDPEIPKIFDRFYRIDKSRSRTLGGSGLGLAIVQSIAQLYGGSVTLTSQVGQGTTVILSLPLFA